MLQVDQFMPAAEEETDISEKTSFCSIAHCKSQKYHSLIRCNIGTVQEQELCVKRYSDINCVKTCYKATRHTALWQIVYVPYEATREEIVTLSSQRD
jgi:hypothetical protein